MFENWYWEGLLESDKGKSCTFDILLLMKECGRNFIIDIDRWNFLLGALNIE